MCVGLDLWGERRGGRCSNYDQLHPRRSDILSEDDFSLFAELIQVF